MPIRRRFFALALALGLRRAWSVAGAVTVVVGGSLVAAWTAVAGWSAVGAAGALGALALLVLAEGAYLAWRDQYRAADALQPSARRKALGTVVSTRATPRMIG